MNVDVRDLQDSVKIDRGKITRCAEFVLKAMGEGKAELSLLFVTDSDIKRLNWKYRRVKSRTDVLAFSMRQGAGLSRDSSLLGDVVISTETARREARRRRIPVQREICLYLVHGILHLLGYKDEGRKDRARMQAKEAELLEAM